MPDAKPDEIERSKEMGEPVCFVPDEKGDHGRFDYTEGIIKITNDLFDKKKATEIVRDYIATALRVYAPKPKEE